MCSAKQGQSPSPLLFGLRLTSGCASPGFGFPEGPISPYVGAAPDLQKGPEEVLHRRGLNNVPYQTPELVERYLEGIRKAGLNGDWKSEALAGKQ